MAADGQPPRQEHRLDYFVPSDDAVWHVEESGGAFTIVVDPDGHPHTAVPWILWIPGLLFAAAGVVVLGAVAAEGNVAGGLCACTLLWLVGGFWTWMALAGRRTSRAERQRAQRRLTVTDEGVRLVKPHEQETRIPRAAIRRISVRHGQDIPDTLDGGEEGGWIELETDGEPVVFYVPASADELARLAAALERRLALKL